MFLVNFILRQIQKNLIDFKKILTINLSSKRITELLLHFIFLLLLCVSYSYFLERTIPFDGAYYSFKIIFYENFNIENERWGACYNQILPLLGVKMGFPLPTILKLYSMSFVICNYIFFLIIFYGFKQTYTAIAFVFTQLIAYRYNFYYQVSEIHAIIGPIFLMVACVMSERFMREQKKIGVVLFLLLIFWLLNIHLLSIIIIAFCLAYLFLNNKSLWRNYYLIVGVLAGFVYFYLKLKSIPINSYQNQKLVSFENIRYTLFNLNKIHGYSYFKNVWAQNYILPSVLGAFMVFYYVYKRMTLKLFLLVISVFGLWVLLMTSSIIPDSPIGYENYYALFGYLIMIPFIFDFIRHLNFVWYFPTLLLILTLSFSSIITCGNFMNH